MSPLLITYVTITLLYHGVTAQPPGPSGCIELQGEGYVRSRGYPSDYHINEYQCWVLTAMPDMKVRLEFSDFQLEGGVECPYDSVTIYNDAAQSSQQGCSRCGTILPDDVTSTGEVMYIEFRSDESVTDRGFDAYFTSVDVDNVPVQVCALDTSDSSVLQTEVPPLVIEDAQNVTFEIVTTQLVLPSEPCDEPTLYHILSHIVEIVRTADQREFHMLANMYHHMGVDIQSDQGLQALACYMASVSSLSDIAALIPQMPVEALEYLYRRFVPAIQMIDPDIFRQGMLVIHKQNRWIRRTGFPALPLVGTTYMDTWQFFTDLQAEVPEGLLPSLSMLGEQIWGPGTVEGFPAYQMLTKPPEALARVCHDPDGNATGLYELFDGHETHQILYAMEMNILTLRFFYKLDTVWSPLAVAGFELEQQLARLGWLDF